MEYGRVYHFENNNIGKLSMLAKVGEIVVVPYVRDNDDLREKLKQDVFVNCDVPRECLRYAYAQYDRCDRESAWLNWIGVNNDYRYEHETCKINHKGKMQIHEGKKGTGIGTQAMCGLAKDLKFQSFNKIVGQVKGGALGFYKKLGCGFYQDEEGTMFETSVNNPKINTTDLYLDTLRSGALTEMINDDILKC